MLHPHKADHIHCKEKRCALKIELFKRKYLAILMMPPPATTACPTRIAAAQLRAVPFTNVSVADKFRSPRLETRRIVTILHNFEDVRADRPEK